MTSEATGQSPQQPEQPSGIVVSDSNPLGIFVEIGIQELLRRRFSAIHIPRQVAQELADPHAPEAKRRFVANPPAWVSIHDVDAQTVAARTTARVDSGEAAAIELALRLKAAVVLMDDDGGYKAARRAGLNVVRSLRLLRDAAIDGQISDLRDIMDRLLARGYMLPPRAVLEQVVREVRQARNSRPTPDTEDS